MTRLALVAVLLTTCTPPAARNQMTGAAAPRVAVDQFMSAIRAKDLQALGAIWGSEHGPARGQVEDFERRGLIMMCYLTHDRYRIMGERPALQGTDVEFQVEVTREQITRASTFTVVRGPSDRWYLSNVHLPPLADLCRDPPR